MDVSFGNSMKVTIKGREKKYIFFPKRMEKNVLCRTSIIYLTCILSIGQLLERGCLIFMKERGCSIFMKDQMLHLRDNKNSQVLA